MNRSQIDTELTSLGLKNKLRITLKYYLFNTPSTELSCFYRILDLLKEKYTDAKDYNFIEQGIKGNLQNTNHNTINALSNMSQYICNCNNMRLLEDLLNSIDTGINSRLEYHHNNLEKLILENTNITTETGHVVNSIQEDIQGLHR